MPYLPYLPYLPFVEVPAAFCPMDFVGAQLFATNSLDTQHFDAFDERSQSSDFISGPPTSGIPLRLDEDEFFQGPSGSNFLTDLDPGMHSDTTMPQGMGTSARTITDPAAVKEEQTHLSDKELLFVADEANKPAVAAVGKRRVRKGEPMIPISTLPNLYSLYRPQPPSLSISVIPRNLLAPSLFSRKASHPVYVPKNCGIKKAHRRR